MLFLIFFWAAFSEAGGRHHFASIPVAGSCSTSSVRNNGRVRLLQWVHTSVLHARLLGKPDHVGRCQRAVVGHTLPAPLDLYTLPKKYPTLCTPQRRTFLAQIWASSFDRHLGSSAAEFAKQKNLTSYTKTASEAFSRKPTATITKMTQLKKKSRSLCIEYAKIAFQIHAARWSCAFGKQSRRIRKFVHSLVLGTLRFVDCPSAFYHRRDATGPTGSDAAYHGPGKPRVPI